MSTEQADDAAPAEAEGGHKGGKLHGLLHGPHSTEILVVCSIITVVLGYMTFRGKSGGKQAAAAQVSPTGISAGDVAGFDQASVQGLTDQLSTMAQAQAGAFQNFSDAIGAEAQAQKDAQDGLTTAIGNQSQQLSTLNTSISALPQAIANKLPQPIAAPPAPMAPAPGGGGGGTVYTVKAGDNLSKIAARFPNPAITWQTIYAANRSTIGPNASMIHPGQQLRIA